ncbi:uncharacterized protein [Dysidea avara]|uniref:uncharacterized protein isoform X3 n=1 Tax=Dysidea avara TaxID=196820 RepID=UPI00332A5D55
MRKPFTTYVVPSNSGFLDHVMYVCFEGEIQIGDVQVPPKMHKKGRPKGNGLKVIGLPKKVKGTSTKPTTFLKKSQWEKSKLMLSWFVDDEKVTDALHNNILIEEEDVEVQPECVPMKYLDENVCMSRVRRYFTNDAWELAESVMATISKRQVWLCSSSWNWVLVIASCVKVAWSGVLARKSHQSRKSGFVGDATSCNSILLLTW